MEGRVCIQLTIVFFLECWFSLLVLLPPKLQRRGLVLSLYWVFVSSVERAGSGEREYTFSEVGANGTGAELVLLGCGTVG